MKEELKDLLIDYSDKRNLDHNEELIDALAESILSKVRPTSNIEKLIRLRPELVDQFSSMNSHQLLDACCAESLDVISYEEKVQVFMIECTGMSKTNYTIPVIKELISNRREDDLNEFCNSICDGTSDEEILYEVKKRAILIN